MLRIFYLVVFLFFANTVTLAQCTNPNTIFFEDFEGGSPVTGAITSNIYGGGTHNNANYVISGSLHGWFNVINGVGDVDVYDRQINGFCVGLPVEVSLWTRHSYGSTNVTFTVEDDNGVIQGQTTMDLTTTYQQIFLNFVATTPGVRLIIHCNSTGGNGVDIVVEDILMTECPPQGEELQFADCDPETIVDLYPLFSSAIGNTGSWSGPTALANGHLGTYDGSLNTSGTYTYSEGAGCTATVSTVEVNLPPSLDLGPDTVVCSGTAVTLDAGGAHDAYLWSNGMTNQSVTVVQGGTYSVEASAQLGNIVQNGDFENGTTNTSNNFTTAYAVGMGGAWGPLSNPGTYVISTNSNLTHNNFASCTDHTSGTGNMLVANGSSVPGTIVWQQTVPVNPATDYLFSFWAMNVVNQTPSSLQLYVNGAPIGPTNNTTTQCAWLEINGLWNSGALTSANLTIVNQSTASSGNDFAIDDISFGPICVMTDTVVVTVENPTQTISVIDPSCNGIGDGEIHVDNALAIEYSNDNGTTWQTDSFFVAVPAGAYDICSRTALGCAVCENVIVSDPAAVQLTMSPDITICENGTTTISANATGGISFDYHWDFTTSTASAQDVTPGSTTLYSVYAENENGCQSATESMTVTMYPSLSGTIAPTITVCPGFPANLTASAAGGNGGPYTFDWSSGQSNTTAGTDQITVTPQNTTTYTVTISDACESSPISMDVEVVVAPLPEPSFQILSPPQCEPGIFEIQNTTDPNLTESIVWVVNNDEVFVDQEIIVTQPYTAGSYNLEMTVTSGEGCVSTVLFEDALVVAPTPQAAFTFSPSPPTMFNTRVLFNNSSIGADTYQWYFEEGEPSSSTQENTSTVFPDGQVGTYEVMLIATSDLGCMDTAILDVQVYPEVILYAPNTFTPDGDEHNQNCRVYIEGVDIYDFVLTIYNRWGQIIWETRDPNEGWDGSYNGAPIQDGMYVWTITTRDLLNDGHYEFNGHVNVLR